MFLEFRDDSQLEIIDDVIKKTLMLKYFAHNHVCSVFNVKNLHTYKKVCHVNDLIHHSNICINISRLQEIGNEIIGNNLGSPVRLPHCKYKLYK